MSVSCRKGRSNRHTSAMKLSKREEWLAIFFICLSIHCLGRHSFIVNFHDMDNRLITMSTAPNNPNLSHTTLVLQRQHHPAAGSAGFRYQGLEESAWLLCLHLPIRPHGTKNFFFFLYNDTRILRFFQIFQCICFYQEKETFCCKERGFGRRCKRAYLGGERDKGDTGTGARKFVLLGKFLVEPGYLSTC